MGTRYNRLNEAVLTCTHNLCFEQKYENSQKISTENCHFYSREKSLLLNGRVFRNVCGFDLRLQHSIRLQGKIYLRVVWMGFL